MIERDLFVDPTTRIATTHASMRECSQHYPMTVDTDHGWITIDKTIKPAPKPSKLNLINIKLLMKVGLDLVFIPKLS